MSGLNKEKLQGDIFVHPLPHPSSTHTWLKKKKRSSFAGILQRWQSNQLHSQAHPPQAGGVHKRGVVCRGCRHTDTDGLTTACARAWSQDLQKEPPIAGPSDCHFHTKARQRPQPSSLVLGSTLLSNVQSFRRAAAASASLAGPSRVSLPLRSCHRSLRCAVHSSSRCRLRTSFLLSLSHTHSSLTGKLC